VIDALIAGKLYGTAVERTANNGNRFATAKVRVASINGESVFVSVIAFANAAVTALLDMTAHAVLTAYHVTRKRQAINNPSEAAA
jgi:hypothetical protein